MRLAVWWDGAVVGHVFVDDAGALAFSYTKAAARPISASLPLDGPAVRKGTFFSNLLPEATLRTRLAARLGVSDDNDFALLAAVGGDCAGALSLVVEGSDPDDDDGDARPLTPALLQRFRETGTMATLVEQKLRLSLAGAQDKLAVVVVDGVLALPRGSAPSTHILKLPSRDWRGLAENELLVLETARAAGLVVPLARLVHLDGFDDAALLVARFDRETNDGVVRRIHQEDLCQATGRPPSKKYEAEDGPSLQDVVTVLRAESAAPALDIERLWRWQIVNVLCGNADGHGKNLALLRGASVSLAPAYDLVCTRQWPSLSTSLALAVGGVTDVGHLGPRAWAQAADDCGVARKLVLSRVEEAQETLPALASATAKALALSKSPVPKLVAKLCRRSKTLFSSETLEPRAKKTTTTTTKKKP